MFVEAGPQEDRQPECAEARPQEALRDRGRVIPLGLPRITLMDSREKGAVSLGGSSASGTHRQCLAPGLALEAQSL